MFAAARKPYRDLLAPRRRSGERNEERGLPPSPRWWPARLALLALLLTCSWAPVVQAAGPVIVLPADALPAEELGAREVRRYVYLRTGTRLNLTRLRWDLPAGGGFLVASKDRPLVAAALQGSAALETALALGPGAHLLKTVEKRGRRWVVLTGGDGPGTLYAAYRYAEWLGVRFSLHGDAVPERPVAFSLPMLHERAAPLFALRGIQPFHDFPEGPDWWNTDDYLAILAQLPKLKMNFFGLHTYPEDRPNAEPTVWIGRPSDLTPDGRATFAYPASYMNTLRGNWGYEAKNTSAFVHGGSHLFEEDAFGADLMLGHCPQPEDPGSCHEVFTGTVQMLRRAFQQARQFGIQTCVGTETPLIIPKRVQARLREAGLNPADRAVVREIYEGIFRWVEQSYAPDYYWFWTPEGWTWEGTKDEQVRATVDDLFDAIAAHRKVKPGFQLATCGWVLGPQQDRALFDKTLPKEVAVSCINREVGKTPVEPGFADVRGRGKWAIPWLEDDPALTSPQLWVGRMRRDAADAYRYGCDGLMGIHWRTRVLGPNVQALARAAWTQDPWSRPFEKRPEPKRAAGPLGGNAAAFPNNPIADTEEDRIYQDVRYNLAAYHLPVPDGTYRVTLKFCEPHYAAPQKRIFGVKIQGRTVLDQFDIFARVGQNRALDFACEGIAVTNGWLSVDFIPQVEFPSIAALVIEGENLVRKINCGGPAWGNFEADLPVQGTGRSAFPPVDDFFADWAASEFGPEAGPAAAALFGRLDGALPRPSDWVNGPGGLKPDPRPWSEVAMEYGFVSDLEALRPLVRGAGYRERFDYWLDTFRYLRATARVNWAWADYNRAWETTRTVGDAAARRERARTALLPLRRQLVQAVEEVYRHLLAHAGNMGELGTIANWDQHILPSLLDKPGQELAQMIGEELPADAQPARTYNGPTRLLVTTQRTTLARGESLDLRVRILSSAPPRQTEVNLRPLGRGAFTSVPLPRVSRGVHQASLTTSDPDADFEYYVEVTDAKGSVLRWPATAPGMNHTVVRTQPTGP